MMTPCVKQSMNLSRNRGFVFRRVVGIVSTIFVASTLCLPVASAQSLDDELFRDLTEPDVESLQGREEVAREQFQQTLRDELEDPDSSGRASHAATHALDGTRKAMQRVQARLLVRDASIETRQIQAGIVKDLEKLIEALQQQQRQKSAGGQQNAAENPSQGKQSPTPNRPSADAKSKTSDGQQKSSSNADPRSPEASPKPTSSSPADGKQALPDSQMLEGKSVAVTAQASQDQLMQSAWGSLPVDARQQMQSARPERFLPKYEQLIEEYFRRLSEESE